MGNEEEDSVASKGSAIFHFICLKPLCGVGKCTMQDRPKASTKMEWAKLLSKQEGYDNKNNKYNNKDKLRSYDLSYGEVSPLKPLHIIQS